MIDFESQDRIMQLAQQVYQLREKLCDALGQYDDHILTCPDCNKTHRCADASLLEMVVLDLNCDHTTTLNQWRERKYGSEVAS